MCHELRTSEAERAKDYLQEIKTKWEGSKDGIIDGLKTGHDFYEHALISKSVIVPVKFLRDVEAVLQKIFI